MQKLSTILSVAALVAIFGFTLKKSEKTPLFNPPPPAACDALTGIDKVICLADAFKTTLTAAQVTTVQLPYTFTDATKWSNLPNGLGSLKRVGIQFSKLNATQLTAAKELLKEVTSSTADEGYAELNALLAADAYLGANGGGASTYNAGNYFMAFLGTPSKTGLFEIQFGGHHYTFGITYNNGKIIGATPQFRGAEPAGTFTQDGVTYQPLLQEKAAFAALLKGFSSTETATAKLSASFSDILLGPNKDNQFPVAKQGIKAGTLDATKKALVIDAIKTYVNDLNTADAATVLAKYQAELDETYVAFSGSGTMNTKNDYIRIDGLSVWIEYSTQGGIVIKAENHPHSVWRDRKTDYDNGKVLGIANLIPFEGKFTVFPNPIADNATVEISVEQNAIVTLNVMDMTGKKVLATQKSNITSGDFQFSLNMNGLASGMYNCTLEVKIGNETKIATKKITKL
jgi:hypothetical protein